MDRRQSRRIRDAILTQPKFHGLIICHLALIQPIHLIENRSGALLVGYHAPRAPGNAGSVSDHFIASEEFRSMLSLLQLGVISEMSAS